MLERPRRIALILAAGAALLGPAAAIASGTEPAPLATVKALDAKRYLGTWHQIAFIPNFFQRKCSWTLSFATSFCAWNTFATSPFQVEHIFITA